MRFSATVSRRSVPSPEEDDRMNEPAELTLEELHTRIRAAGITIAENRLAMVRKLLSDALVHVRALDAGAVKTVEPAVRFDAGDEARA
jgi:hypothetical protein